METNSKELGLAIEGRVVHVKIRGKLEQQDYELFAPKLETLLEKYDTVNMLVELVDFKGWTLGALWEDTKFAAKHFSDIERLAIVGDSRWEEGMAVFCKPFTRATVRFFKTAEMDQAERWVQGKDDS